MDELIRASTAPTPALEEAGSFNWKIEDWSAKAREKCLRSDVFVIGGKKWCARGVVAAAARRAWRNSVGRTAPGAV